MLGPSVKIKNISWPVHKSLILSCSCMVKPAGLGLLLCMQKPHTLHSRALKQKVPFIMNSRRKEGSKEGRKYYICSCRLGLVRWGIIRPEDPASQGRMQGETCCCLIRRMLWALQPPLFCLSTQVSSLSGQTLITHRSLASTFRPLCGHRPLCHRHVGSEIHYDVFTRTAISTLAICQMYGLLSDLAPSR